MSLAKTYTLVGSATLASRLTGFVRDVMIAAVLGSSAVADAYIAAFLLPNLFRRVLSEGAFNAAFVPIYARRKAEGGEASVEVFIEHALSSLIALVLAALVLAEAFMPQIMGLIAPGFTGQAEKFADAVQFSRIAFVFVAVLIIVALLSSVLNAMGRYALVALAPLILNFLLIGVLSVLLALGWRGEHRAGLALVLTVLVAGFAQLAYVLWGAHRAKAPLRLGLPQPDRDVRLMLLMILPGLVLAGAGHFNMVVAAQMVSGHASAVSWLYYADRVFQLPLGFVAAAIGTVLLPEVARAIRANDHAGAEHARNRALEFGLLLVLPAAAALVILAEPIVDIIYRRGAFAAADSAATAAVLRALALGLPGFVLVKAFLPPYLAREAMRLPIHAALAGIAVNIVLTWFLLPRYGVAAAALGVATSAWVNAAILAVGLWRRDGTLLDAEARAKLARITLATCITASTAWLAEHALAEWLAASAPFALRASALIAICIAGVATHGVAAHFFGAADFSALRGWLKTRGA